VKRKAYELVIRRKSALPTYREIYTLLPKGEYREFFIPPNTSIYTSEAEPSVVAFYKKPYLVMPEGDHFLLITPSWTGLAAGWLDPRSTEDFKVYRVDRFALWAHLIPKELLELFDFPEPPFKNLRIEGDHLIGPGEELAGAWRRYRNHLLRRDKLGIRIREGRILSLYEKLLLDGVVPFAPKQVRVLDKWEVDFELRPYQREAFEFWLQHGAMALIWPYGAGKTFFAMRLMAAVSGPTLIVTPGKAVLKTIERYLREHLYGPRIGVWYAEEKRWGDVIISTYHSVLKDKKRFKGPWDLLLYDECHHWPAPTYTAIGFIEAKYRAGMSGSPWREDGKTHLIYMLSGPPYGHDWSRLIEEGWVRKPKIFLHLTDYKLAVCKRLAEELPPRLLIYCDRIDLGRELSGELNIPFLHGAHSAKTREKLLQTHDKLACSRIFDEGIDLPDLRSMIEYDFMGGSRRQESQRAGRLMHCLSDGATYHILMHPDEYEKYGKRLQALYARGFDIELVRE